MICGSRVAMHEKGCQSWLFQKKLATFLWLAKKVQIFRLMCAVRPPNSTKSDQMWLEWCLAEIFWFHRSYLGNIRGCGGPLNKTRIFRAAAVVFRPCFTALGLPNSTKSDQMWLKWCLAEIFWCGRSYLGNIRGHSGSLYQNRIFWAAAVVFLPNFAAVRLPNSTSNDQTWLKWCLTTIF